MDGEEIEYDDRMKYEIVKGVVMNMIGEAEDAEWKNPNRTKIWSDPEYSTAVMKIMKDIHKLKYE
tara:strand:- start:1305 stop:1499 length:195 start_codon:yes stop_codon:yes gene_type:complete